MVAAWDIYAKALFDLGFGHPKPPIHWGETHVRDVEHISDSHLSNPPVLMMPRSVIEAHQTTAPQTIHDHILRPLLTSGGGVDNVTVRGQGIAK